MPAEIIVAVLAGVLVLGVLWLLSYCWVHHWDPAFKRPKIIAALEESERIGLSDIDSYPKRAAKRWNLLRMGHNDFKRLRTEEIRDRLALQLAVLSSREEELKKLNDDGAWGILKHLP